MKDYANEKNWINDDMWDGARMGNFGWTTAYKVLNPIELQGGNDDESKL